MSQLHEGGCHCGRVRFRVTEALAGLTACNCSICQKKGFLHWIVPQEAFQLLSGADDLVTYRFNTGVAQHRFCRHCGIHSFYVPRSDPDKIDVNVRCLDGVDPARLQISHFDGQNWEASMQGHVPWRQPRAGIVLVATLGVRKEALEQFHAYERTAARVMRRYGGEVTRTVALPCVDPAMIEELHLVTFPDAETFAAYQRDPELVAAAPLRAASIATTQVVIGAEGPDYHQEASG
jgi:uncharacterized protein (DUF1330 family)